MKLTLLIVSFLFALSSAHAKVVGKTIAYQIGDDTFQGYLAYDDASDEKRPGVLVVHEWWGQNEYARKRADMLAELGYVALALDMYGQGKVAQHPADAKKFSSQVMANAENAKSRFMSALRILQSQALVQATDIAAIGYCFGGGVVLEMARQGAPLDAVVSFHGSLASQYKAKEGEVQAKVLVVHGAADPLVSGEDILALMKEMNEAKVDFQFIAYGGVQHSFTNPAATAVGEKFGLPLEYDQQADAASWRAMQVLFERAFATK